MLRKDKWPELPPGYLYERSGTCISISYKKGTYWTHLRHPGSIAVRYWKKPENAALAAWKHAYEQLKEGTKPC